jgi:hypothetical protein
MYKQTKRTTLLIHAEQAARMYISGWGGFQPVSFGGITIKQESGGKFAKIRNQRGKMKGQVKLKGYNKCKS